MDAGFIKYAATALAGYLQYSTQYHLSLTYFYLKV